jgi:hypothetical protein
LTSQKESIASGLIYCQTLDDKSDWINEYSFRYSLSPAKYWRSFGSLEVIIDRTAFTGKWKTNLEEPSDSLNSIVKWNFSKLPSSDHMEIVYKPSVNWFAKLLIAITPAGLALIIALLIFLMHLKKVKQFRIRKPASKYSSVVIVGSIVNAFLILAGFVLAYPIIDAAIGEDVSRHHGYVFLVIIFYPVLLLVYWTLMTWMDWRVRWKINKMI